MKTLNEDQIDFLVRLLDCHAEGLCQWLDKDGNWPDEYIEDEYNETKEIRQLLG